MPLYEYICENGHKQEDIVIRLEDADEFKMCPCGEPAPRQFGRPTFKLGWVPTVNDSGDVWDGTPLEDVDKVNPLTYKSDKIFLDRAKKTQVSGKAKPKPTKGVAALGV